MFPQCVFFLKQNSDVIVGVVDLQLCWWWCSLSAGRRFTSTVSCGATFKTVVKSSTKSSSTCTWSPVCSFTWAQPWTPSCTASCPHASESCSGRLRAGRPSRNSTSHRSPFAPRCEEKQECVHQTHWYVNLQRWRMRQFLEVLPGSLRADDGWCCYTP